MEQAAEDERGRRTMECSSGSVDDGGARMVAKLRCSKCNGDGRGDGGGHDHGCIEGNGIDDAATAATATTKAATMREAKAMGAAWLQG
jgi:hypothetical protein